MTAPAITVLARTTTQAGPGPVAHRARLRGQRAFLRRWPEAGRRLLGGPRPAAAAGWPPAFRSLDAQTPRCWPELPELAAGRIRLLGIARDLGDPADWAQAGAPLLWRFHLHYWDWAWGLATAPDRLAARALFSRLWRSWQASAEFGRGDAWLPYPAAVRAWAWCGLHRDLVAGADFEPSFAAGLAAHAGFLRWHLESDVGGNHLIKNLKALTGLAVFFRDERLLRFTVPRLARQVAVQVLPDGGHYERAPAYHCQVLADLADIAGLLAAGGYPPVPGLTAAVGRMRQWLGAVTGPDGQVPMLNDGYPVARELVTALRPVAPPSCPLAVLPDTGLVQAVCGRWHLLADVGAPGAAPLCAHAHAGTLGCLLYVGGMPLLIDTGTSTYEPGPERDYQRSTAAHNTAEVDGANSTEVWGAFRSGRRARVAGRSAVCDASGVHCAAAHDGFRWLPGRPVHHRHWLLTGAGLRVDDLIRGRGRHAVAVRWQLAPGCQVRVTGNAATITASGARFRVTVRADRPVTITAESRPVATGFSATTDAPALTCRAEAPLPLALSTVWEQVAP